MTPRPPAVMHEDATLVTFAKDQPQYTPLPAAVSPDGVVMTEWVPSAEDLAALLAGGCVRVFQHTFRRPLQPLLVEVGAP